MAPAISIVTPTWNRAHTLPRALDSLLRQTCADWEAIVVDDGSTDDTRARMEEYTARDPRIRYVAQATNRGVLAARNTAFDRATGDWITTLDSDDELVPEALEVLLAAASRDPSIDSVGANCVDSVTGALTGQGLDHDRYITYREILDRSRGEHWGMFRRALLGDLRFNERLHGMEGVLWAKLYADARIYYVHRGLRVYHTEGRDRIGARTLPDARRAVRLYESFAALVDDEQEHLERLRTWSPREHRRTLFNALGQFALHGDRERFAKTYAQLRATGAVASPMALRAVLAVSPLTRFALRRGA